MDTRTRPVALVWKVSVLFAATCVAALALATAPRLARMIASGSASEWGFQAEPPRASRMTLQEIDPASSLAAAGAKPGDVLELERPIDIRSRPEPADSIAGTVRRGDTATKLVLAGMTRQVPIPERAAYVLALVDLVVMLGIGLLVGLRRPKGFANRCLALFFIVSAATMLPYDSIPAAIFLPAFTAQQVVTGCAPWLMLAFAIYYPDEAPELRRRGLARLMPLWSVLGVATVFSMVWQVFYGTGQQTVFALSIFILFLALFIASLVQGLRVSEGEHRQRFKWMLLSFGVGLGACVPTWVPGWETSPIPILVASTGIFLAIVGLAYATLRHHVLDFGFAVNRAIVYTALTGVLMFAFYVVEKAAEHYIHLEGETRNAFLDAAIGLALYLAVHKVKHRVDHSVERIFFREWHRRDAQLQSFVGTAIHYTRSRSLCDAYAHALRSFAGGANVAVYELDAADNFRRESGDDELPPSIDADHPVAVALRASRAAVADDALQDLGARLALPFNSHDGIRGFVLLGGRPPGNMPYRPDEVRALERSAHEVGIVLQALEGERLKREVEVLSLRLDAAMRMASMSAPE